MAIPPENVAQLHSIAHIQIDDEFLKVLSALAGSGVEMAFERRGESAGTIQILRTRTHAGEVHTMGLRYFLSATAPTCEPLINSLARARLQADLQKGIAREKAIEQVKASAGASQSPALTQSRFQGMATGTMAGYPSNRFIFADEEAFWDVLGAGIAAAEGTRPN